MKLYIGILLFLIWAGTNQAQVYKKTNYSPTYEEIISFYKNLEKKYPQSKLKKEGKTDIGLPIHVFTINSGKKNTAFKKIEILINNGIHPGEPDGINASMQLADELLSNWKKYKSIFDTITLHIIAVYNVDGCLRRGNTSRANQDGPLEYGFRGNYQNLDLNRDFIKADSKNAMTFIEIFQNINPHILVDTHVSNGADYQYTFTYFFSQTNKLDSFTATVYKKMEKSFKEDMLLKKIETVPYVNHHAETPLDGIHAFYDSPRYCTGFASLFNCVAITTETHMLKPFDDRVNTTYESLWSLIHSAKKHYIDLIEMKRKSADKKLPEKLGVNYVLDTTQYEEILFKGFQSGYRKSEVTQLDQLYYDRSKPVEKKIKYYNSYKPSLFVNVPQAYIIPQSWDRVNDRLRITLGNKGFIRLEKDSIVEADVYLIKETSVGKNPYEGHYYHNKVTTEIKKVKRKFYKGDFIYEVTPANLHYLINVLEPEAEDSYFRWNFFDACLQQKEWFSDYVFDEKAKEILENNPELKKTFEQKKKDEPEFAKNGWDQLYFVYKNSHFYEQTAFEIPVYKIFK